jgi:hypothetical protein
MANTFIWANNASSTLAGPITPSATSLTLASGTGALFPNPSAGQQFGLTLVDAATGLNTEIMYCTARTGDVCTVVRGQEGTAAQSWIAGDLAANLLTAAQLAALVQQVTLAPNRTVTASGAFSITTADANGRIGLNRTAAVGTSSATLPAGASPGQTYTVEDLAGNFQAFPCTINAPGGMSIAGLSSFVCNVNRQSVTFTYYGSNIWSVAS